MREQGLGFWVSIATIAAAIFGLCQVVVSIGAWLFPVVSSQPSAPSPLEPAKLPPQPELSVPLLTSFADFLGRFPRDTWPLLLTTAGLAMIGIGIWLLLQTGHYEFGENYSCVIVLVSWVTGVLIGYQVWGVGGAIIGVVLIGPFLGAILSLPSLSWALLGAVIGTFAGCGAGFLYLAIRGLFMNGWIVAWTLTGAILGTLLGLILKRSHSLSSLLKRPERNDEVLRSLSSPPSRTWESATKTGIENFKNSIKKYEWGDASWQYQASAVGRSVSKGQATLDVLVTKRGYSFDKTIPVERYRLKIDREGVISEMTSVPLEGSQETK